MNFKYNSLIGGGIFYKTSILFLGNNLLLYMASFVGLFLIFFYYNDKFDYILLFFLITTSFSSGIYIFQKYFEPLIIFIFFLFFDKKLINRIFEKNINIVFFYFFGYWLIYFLYGSKTLSIS